MCFLKSTLAIQSEIFHSLVYDMRVFETTNNLQDECKDKPKFVMAWMRIQYWQQAIKHHPRKDVVNKCKIEMG